MTDDKKRITDLETIVAAQGEKLLKLQGAFDTLNNRILNTLQEAKRHKLI